MEPTLGLGGGSGGGGGAVVGLNTIEQNSLYASKDYMDMSKETELELGLGLSLGNGAGLGLKEKEKEKEKEKGVSAAWGDYGRILTAKDFPNGFSTSRPDLVSSGTKRERMSSDFVEQGGSNSAAVSQVVGWPPIKGYRMNTLYQTKTSNIEDDKKVGGNEKKETSNKKINHGNEKTDTTIKERGHLGFVKVNMDGLPIGRKVDLNNLKNYDTLAKVLEDMFFKPSLTLLGSSGGNEHSVKPPRLFDASSEFVLTYEDKEGDWMLVGDVPWGMFFNTVKRLRIMKTSEAKGLAPKFQERNEKQKCRPI